MSFTELVGCEDEGTMSLDQARARLVSTTESFIKEFSNDAEMMSAVKRTAVSYDVMNVILQFKDKDQDNLEAGDIVKAYLNNGEIEYKTYKGKKKFVTSHESYLQALQIVKSQGKLELMHIQ